MMVIILILLLISILFVWKGNKKYAFIFFVFSLILSVGVFINDITTKLTLQL